MTDSVASDSVTEGVVASLLASVGALWSGLPDGVWLESTDLVRYSTGRGRPRLNGIAVVGPEADEESAAAWLDLLASRGWPFCLLSRGSAPDWVAGLAARNGLTDLDEEPLMVHRRPGSVVVPEGATITRVDPEDADEVGLAQQLFAEGFEGPEQDLGIMMGADVLRVPGLDAYVGRQDRIPVTTGFGALNDGYIGVFNIATPPAHRRRGHGHAVTAAVIAEGVAAGAHTAYLQSSPMGHPIYERMGFRTIEIWPSYYPAE